MMLSQCNNPTYVGDGKVCGIDSDYDEFPDMNLNCDIIPSCEEVCRRDSYNLSYLSMF